MEESGIMGVEMFWLQLWRAIMLAIFKHSQWFIHGESLSQIRRISIEAFLRNQDIQYNENGRDKQPENIMSLTLPAQQHKNVSQSPPTLLTETF